jgi:hypothetical protein
MIIDATRDVCLRHAGPARSGRNHVCHTALFNLSGATDNVRWEKSITRQAPLVRVRGMS